MPKKPDHNKNLLDAIPVRCVEWTENPEGKIALVAPKFRLHWMRTLIVWLNFKPDFHIHLDDFGSFIWRECDGKQNCHAIGIALKTYFGNDVEPVFDRLGIFIRLLVARRLVRLNFGTD